ncbi:MAG: HAMP domain-containing protein [Thiotrichales bacterium]|jgi:signal transduction histidine kinase|nr:HAMP domain-containing protein [Thiotrichales bacterium]MBT3751821.1 HAMP domain-containing protein [Thiotrichales bacterium]MBT3838048.1 HAMP domain-containing protein [Thiotrichales bacterium]MBT4152039.1 HAMP domain-containing protein [Thiotrichales bacterium]MBT4262552.1 HAMP domain-containing protein [Thiotrichales bacterium]
MRFSSLQGRLLSGQTILVLTLIALLGGMSYGMMAKQIEHLNSKLLHNTVEAIESTVEHHFERRTDDMERILRSDSVVHYRQNRQKGIVKQLFQQYRESFYSLVYLDAEGVQQVAWSGGAEESIEINQQRVEQLWRRAVAEPNQLQMGAPYQSRDGEELVDLGLLTTDYFDEIEGALVATVPLATLRKQFSHYLPKNFGVGLVQRDGSVLLAGTKQHSGKNILHHFPDGGHPASSWIGEKISTQDSRNRHSMKVVRFQVGGNDILGMGHPISSLGVMIVVTIPAFIVEQPLHELRTEIFVIGVGTLLLFSLFSWYFSRTITRPVRRLAEVMQKYGDGEHEVRSLRLSADEVGDLSDRFNQMAESQQKIRAVVEKQRTRAEQQEQYAAFQAGIAEMGASVLHNVGNVITGMNGNILRIEKQVYSLYRIYLLIKKVAEDPNIDLDYREFIEKTVAALKRGHKDIEKDRSLNKLTHSIEHIGSILAIQQSASRPSSYSTEFYMKSVFDDVIALISDKIDKSKVSVEVEMDPKLGSVNLPRNPLIQLLLNLIKNSIEAIAEQTTHSGESGKIIVKTVKLDKDSFELSVEDSGSGYNQEQISEIFTFGKSGKKGGSGFGLHSVANFVTSIGGSINAESSGVGKGMKMIVVLPMNSRKKGV